MHPMLNIAVRAARAGGDHILRQLSKIDSLQIETKQRHDFVTEVDRGAEQLIISTIRKAYPDHAILAEESGEQIGNEYQWIIDPLDGTTNFLHGFPHFAVSIAMRIRKELEISVIYDPMTQELFTAERGRGTQLNNHKVRVSNRPTLNDALIGTGFPFRDGQNVDSYLQLLKEIMLPAAGIRRAGAASLDLAYVAAGRLDGFWETGLQIWDIAGGALMIQEAGGMVTDITGGENYLSSGGVIAGNPKFCMALQKIIKPYAGKL